MRTAYAITLFLIMAVPICTTVAVLAAGIYCQVHYPTAKQDGVAIGFIFGVAISYMAVLFAVPELQRLADRP